MDMYQNAYRVMPSPVNPFEFLPSFLGQPNMGQPKAPDETPPPATGSKERKPPEGFTVEAQAAEAGELRRRIEELEAALARGKHRSKTRKAKVRRKP